MVATLFAVALISTEPQFRPESILEAANFAKTSTEGSSTTLRWTSKSTSTTVYYSLTRFGGDSEDLTSARNSLLRERVNIPVGDDFGSSFRNMPIGAKGAESWLNKYRGRYTYYVFGSSRAIQMTISGEPRIEGTRTAFADLASSDLLAIEDFSRWKLAQIEGTGDLVEVSRGGRTFSSPRINGESSIPLHEYADGRGWNSHESRSVTRQAYSTSRGTLIVHVGSDAIEWNGELIRTGHIHPAKGDEVYLPVSFLDEKGL